MTQRTQATSRTGRTRHTPHARRTRQGAAVLAAALIAAGAGCSAPADRTHRPASQGSGTPAPHGSDNPAPSAAGGATGGHRGFTLVASGDVLPHASIIKKAKTDSSGDGYDFAPMLSGVQPAVSKADLAICHMETVYGTAGQYTGDPKFKSPPEVAKGLRDTGYDSCSTASDHALDDGAAGIDRTLDAMDRAGIRHTGSARTAAEAGSPAWLRAGDAKVAHLAYTYDTNGASMPKGRPWAVNMIDSQRIVEDARAARKAGADVVVLSLHWGTEWQDEPDESQLRLGDELTASRTDGRPDIDLILGTHAHVPQAYEKVNGTWVVYGMGDQIAGEMYNYDGAQDPRGNEGTIGRFTFAPPERDGGRWEVRKAEFLPQWFNVGSGRVINVNQAIHDGLGLNDVRDRISQAVLSRGAAEDGLTMGR
ncbi:MULTISPECIES: CapA family protein [unclassified Streptomyces]|uniref:CapA family protein n=1 Tax=unclassified Streptomyces TaxID=2593676 RepID=UPI002DD7BC8A|nr:CapA family protein [Streptomyces sp. NBC_01445]WSE03215.1 CapA family protein [Streptomyces sp. NBC_01445]